VAVSAAEGDGSGTEHLDELTKRELLQMASDLALEEIGASMTKAEIVEAIQEAAEA
jgi:hypothetical protein